VEKSPVAAALLGGNARETVSVATDGDLGGEIPQMDIGRNDLVEISRGDETRTVKWKKAQALIANEGWTFVRRASAADAS